MIVDLRKAWMNDAMPCLRKNPEMFFGDFGTETMANPSKKVQAKWDRAKNVCLDCPVMMQCARDNLGEIEGVWGGLDPAQRIKLRAKHATQVRALEGPEKLRYATMAHNLRTQQKYAWTDIGRIMGFSHSVAQYLGEWYDDWAAAQEAEREAKTKDLELPEPVATVTEIGPNASFPTTPPKEGDAWIRYGRRVVWGYYLGQTEDDAWHQYRIKILAGEWSVCWIKAEDVKLVRSVTRTVMTRVGKSGSRIYGTRVSKGAGQGTQAG